MSFELELQTALDLFAADNWKEALAAFKHARALNKDLPQEVFILLNEARCLEYLGKFREANNHLKTVDRIDTSGQFRIDLGVGKILLSFAEGNPRQGIEQGKAFLLKYETELKDPEYDNVKYDLSLKIACELISTGQFEAGVDALQRFSPDAKDEDKPRVTLFLGIAYEQLGKYDQAAEEFQRTLQFPLVEDVAAQAHYRLGALYWKKGAVAWAKHHFLEAQNLKHALANVPLRDLYTYLANASGHLGEAEEREKYLELARKI
jgi:tetratricopeptide (TPR) repeat protein